MEREGEERREPGLAQLRLQHNTIHPDIIEDIAEAGSRPPGLPCVQLKRNTSSFVLYYWSIVPALSTNELCWPLWPAEPARAHCPGSDGVTGAGPLSQSPSPATAREVREEQLDLSPAGQHEGLGSLDSGQLRWRGVYTVYCIVVWRWLAPSVFSVQKAR